jgi:hypothetical protein
LTKVEEETIKEDDKTNEHYEFKRKNSPTKSNTMKDILAP